ncbi:MAG: type I-G CRISPR-associated helicase/endonuclease Cas3g [Euzebya sp.]
MTLDLADFPAFFRAVHDGNDPFAWQVALMERVATQGWPEVIDVPTGMGKTAVIDVSIFNLALQADWAAADRTAPTRTFVIVDRRLIVDQTHRHAQSIAAVLDGIDPDGDASTQVAAEVGARLRRLAVGSVDCRALAVVRMRGGTTWDARWLRSPAQPAIITGTVDQLGSRLLFRGYGVSEYSRPIDAALVGTDRLIILDEAHLAWPLVQTLHAVDRHESRAVSPPLGQRHPAPILMSATPPQGKDAPTDVLRLDPSAETSAAALARLGAVRQVRLLDLTTTAKEDQGAALVTAMSSVAEQMLRDGSAPTMLVIANTVGTARALFARLRPPDDSLEVALLIGRVRPIDAGRIVRDHLAALAAGNDYGQRERPLVLVATQTVEVGADIDVAALVTEAAPIDALLQRLGRLDRRGALGTSTAVVVHSSRLHEDAPVYGQATARTWTWLTEKAGSPTPTKPSAVIKSLRTSPIIDLGPRSLAALLEPGELAGMAAEATPAPVVLGPVIDAWAQTSPSPDPDQDVAPFLHGLIRGRAEVGICWRADLPTLSLTDGIEAWREELRTAPPSAHEQVVVPIGEARRFLNGQQTPGGADIEGDEEEGDWDQGTDRQPLVGVIIGAGGEVRPATGRDVRPGETVVLAADSGGYDGWGWTGLPHEGDVCDVADLDIGRRTRLRLRDGILEGLLGPRGEGAPSVSIAGMDDPDHDPTETIDVVRRAALARPGPFTTDLIALTKALPSRPKIRVANGRARGRGWMVLDGGARSAPSLVADRGDGTDSDARSPVVSSGAASPVDLETHLRDVEARARLVGSAMGLDQRLVATLALAGLAHDLGKADPRFQIELYGGDRLRAEATGRLLAKSGMASDDPASFRRARRLSGLPSGFRHEAVSALLLDQILSIAPEIASDLDTDLLVHLVASHHGRGRPLPAAVKENTPIQVSAHLPGGGAASEVSTAAMGVDWDSPSRFLRLGRAYGWWGLALLETVLRLADMEVSREYELVEAPS